MGVDWESHVQKQLNKKEYVRDTVGSFVIGCVRNTHLKCILFYLVNLCLHILPFMWLCIMVNEAT